MTTGRQRLPPKWHAMTVDRQRLPPRWHAMTILATEISNVSRFGTSRWHAMTIDRQRLPPRWHAMTIDLSDDDFEVVRDDDRPRSRATQTASDTDRLLRLGRDVA